MKNAKMTASDRRSVMEVIHSAEVRNRTRGALIKMIVALDTEHGGRGKRISWAFDGARESDEGTVLVFSDGVTVPATDEYTAWVARGRAEELAPPPITQENLLALLLIFSS